MEEYNEDELVPPTWMNTDFFETVLKDVKNNNLKKIINYNIGPATAKGDHYISVMFRAIVQYTNQSNHKQEISLIIKIEPEADGPKKDLMHESTVFKDEIEMFRDIIPKFHEMLRSIGDETILAANMLYYAFTPHVVIVLEDLTKQGFTTLGDKICSIDEKKMALEMLAKWHACSYMLNEQTNGGLEHFTNGIYNMPALDKNPIFTKATERIVEIAKQTPKLQPYVEKLEKIQHLVFKKTTKVYELRKKTRINVLTHGDFHGKNLMFKFDPKTKLANDIILVDFQMCVWGSMALDLIYLMYMTVDGENREKYQDELIYNFFQQFRTNLIKLGFKGKLPKLIDLQIDMLKVSRLEIFLATTFLPFIVSLIDNESNDTVMQNEEVQLNLYKSQRYIDELEPILKRFLNKGIMDSLLEDDDSDDN